MALFEARRWRRLLALVLLLFSILMVLYQLDPGDTLMLKKFVLEENEVSAIKQIIQNYSSTTNSNIEPLLVIFTTMEITQEKENLYENTLRLWPQLKPAVLPVLFVGNLSTEWQQKAKHYGWETLSMMRTFGNLPILRHMWLDVMQKYNGTFYAFANADVLFDESLVLTLQMIRETNTIQKNPFIIGRRTNYFLNPKETLYSLKDVRTSMTKPSAKLFIMHAEDYFITTRSGFPWEDIPDFVIARIGYDNWLVTYALTHYYYVIDVTSTVSCLHQSGSDGNYAGFTHNFLFDINKRLAGEDFKYQLGKTDCAKIETKQSKESRTSIADNGTKGIMLQIRKHSKHCLLWFERQGIDINRIYP